MKRISGFIYDESKPNNGRWSFSVRLSDRNLLECITDAAFKDEIPNKGTSVVLTGDHLASNFGETPQFFVREIGLS
jgi:hypothetical protein